MKVEITLNNDAKLSLKSLKRIEVHGSGTKTFGPSDFEKFKLNNTASTYSFIGEHLIALKGSDIKVVRIQLEN
ncbi:hypothetical protein ACFPVV_01595 [Macrococcoides bohemicum]|uniref:Uncharacterized protein n=1 Tax=Macrococcoides bohemicum TaxID=1903056 RepID=A0A328A6S7_9STAP|nr:hypothetical protein [Macrococcus bohemicus]RAK50179.1 hypothetical protein BHX94_01565 [Macrococcus bohemicus]